MREKICKRIWELSPFVTNATIYTELKALTRELIEVYNEQHRLESNPLASARERVLALPETEVAEKLRGSTCIVSGGLGCVGSHLVQRLLRYDVKQIVVIDNAPCADAGLLPLKVVGFRCDVCNSETIREIFNHYQPKYVFHTAAQRNPGQAETEIAKTIRTNIFGTLNMVEASERVGTVEHFVFSSTGKASRYFTEEIYAATKKICEYILDLQAKTSAIKYSMARFTHILDNSLMDRELESASLNSEFVTVHSPAKYVTAQNVEEAVTLMLNAIIYSEPGNCNFLIARNLEWPVESLEMALFHIRKSGRAVPVIFSGNPLGYSESFFRGQVNWAVPESLNLLINVYEYNHYLKLNEAKDIMISRIISADDQLLQLLMESLLTTVKEEKSKILLVSGLSIIVREILERVPKNQTVDILRWGLDQQGMNNEKNTLRDYGTIIHLLANSLQRTKFYQQVEPLLGKSSASEGLVAEHLHLS